MEDTTLDKGRLEWNTRRNKFIMDTHFGRIVHFRNDDFYVNLCSVLSTLVPLIFEFEEPKYTAARTDNFFGYFYRNRDTYSVEDYEFEFLYQNCFGAEIVGIIVKYNNVQIMKIVLSHSSDNIFDAKSMFGLDMVALQGKRILYHETTKYSTVLESALQSARDVMSSLGKEFESILIYSYSEDIVPNNIPEDVILRLKDKMNII